MPHASAKKYIAPTSSTKYHFIVGTNKGLRLVHSPSFRCYKPTELPLDGEVTLLMMKTHRHMETAGCVGAFHAKMEG